MKDERITQQLNQAKGVVLIFVFISVLAVSMFKFLITNQSLEFYYVEGFILVISLLIITLKFTLFSNIEDERIQKNYERLLNIAFLTMFYGGFVIHFYSVSNLLSESQFSFSFTSTFILIATIVFIVQLKRRSIYASYKWIEFEKWVFIKKTVKRLIIFSLFFSLNIFSYIINGTDVLIGFITIIYSLFSLGSVYFIFTLYEKNHYDEVTLLEQGMKRSITKNASLLLIIPVIYSLISNTVNLVFNQILIVDGSALGTENIALLNRVLGLYSLDISIVTIICFTIIYFYLKNDNRFNSLMKVLKIYVITYSIISVINYVIFLILPVIFASINDIDQVRRLASFNGYLSLLFILYFFVMHMIIAIRLKRINVSNLKLFYLFSIYPIFGVLFSRLAVINESIFLLLLAALCSFGSIFSLCIFFKKKENNINYIHSNTG